MFDFVVDLRLSMESGYGNVRRRVRSLLKVSDKPFRNHDDWILLVIETYQQRPSRLPRSWRGASALGLLG